MGGARAANPGRCVGLTYALPSKDSWRTLIAMRSNTDAERPKNVLIRRGRMAPSFCLIATWTWLMVSAGSSGGIAMPGAGGPVELIIAVVVVVGLLWIAKRLLT